MDPARDTQGGNGGGGAAVALRKDESSTSKDGLRVSPSAAAVMRRMTPEALQEICRERRMWSQPHLNSQLYLNYKGFDAIEGLEEFVNVRALFLGNNNIARIEGLDRMADLRSLHLEGNRITAIENLESNLELRQLNLESNGLRRLSGLAHLSKLEQLNVSNNGIEHIEGLEELRSLPSLANIDVSRNQLEATDGVVEFWSGLSARVKILRYHGNPGVRSVEHYRKRLVNALPQLSYLDERPIFPVERKSCAAWAQGGTQAMQQAKRDHALEMNRAQNSVDPERRELLTRRRKTAIARIEREEREAREREEQQAAQAGQGGCCSSLQSGDPEALADYERTWKTKVNLHGAEGVRAQVAKDTAGGKHGASSWSSGAAHAPTGHRPAPAPEHAEERESAPPPRFAPPPRCSRAARDCAAEPVGAASFIAPQADRCGNADNALEQRQFAVLGDDPWAGSVAGSAFGAAGGARGSARGAGAQGQEMVVPDLWKKLGPAAKQAELRALEQNFEAASLHRGGADTAADASAAAGAAGAHLSSGPGQDALSTLD